MPLPIAHGFVGASIVAATLPDAHRARNWKLLLLGAALSVAPDLDYLFPETEWHRGFTHSLVFAAIVSLVCFAIAGRRNIRVAAGCAGAVFSHTVLDYATTKSMPGVELLWPFSPRRFGLGLLDYYDVTGVDPVYFMAKDILKDIMKAGLMELIIFAPLLLFVLSLKWSLSKRPRAAP